MITTKDFENILLQSETSILDFKKKMYDFEKEKQKANAALIKDVISFTNTIRNETSYIIFGVKELEKGKLDLLGVETTIDEAILQQKVRSNVFPKPIFNYYHINHQGKVFGVLEFPVQKFELPLTPTKNLKGLTAGSVYYRNGTSNTEATGMDIIRINDWLRSLPKEYKTTSLTEKISDLIVKLSKSEEKLSIIISEILAIAKENNWTEIIQFCSTQIKGIRFITDYNSFYRDHKVLGSLLRAEFDSNPFINATQANLRSEMNENKDFYTVQITFTQSLIKLEQIIQKFKQNSGITMTIEERNTKQLSKFNMDAPFYIYCLEDDYKTVYNNIRQQAIDLLMEK